MTSSRVQIVATIGPASGKLDVLRAMVQSHMDVMRLNFSWGTHEEQGSYISLLRKIEKEDHVHIPIIQDLSGPRKQEKEGHHFDSARVSGEGGVMTPKDFTDLEFGLKHGVDYVCLSYVACKEDIEQLRRAIRERGGSAKVMAKIERKDAVARADEIIAASDAMMIGRGDLGEEVLIEKIPFIEKELIEKCNSAGKPVITATQMLYSMVSNPAPTRAEVTDVAFAVVCGSDGIMLSEETARGDYPVEAVAAMERIALEAERNMPERKVNLL